jgi:hypothetical protein
MLCPPAPCLSADFTQWSANALCQKRVTAMKGKQPGDELAVLLPTVAVFHVEQLRKSLV